MRFGGRNPPPPDTAAVIGGDTLLPRYCAGPRTPSFKKRDFVRAASGRLEKNESVSRRKKKRPCTRVQTGSIRHKPRVTMIMYDDLRHAVTTRFEIMRPLCRPLAFKTTCWPGVGAGVLPVCIHTCIITMRTRRVFCA